MCSFMAVRGKVKKIQEKFRENDIENVLEKAALTKGGDETYLVINIPALFITRKIKMEDNKNKIKLSISDNLKDLFNNLQEDVFVNIILFSRLTPEMEESEKSLSQPYITNDQKIVCVHGTIPEAEKIANENNINIEVDTEIFNYLSFEQACIETEKVGGKISAISVDMLETSVKNGIKMYHNGLGLYTYTEEDFEIISNISSDYWPIRYGKPAWNVKEIPLKTEYKKNLLKKEKRLVVLYSGGLDISCSLIKELYNYPNYQGQEYSSIDLLYFDWGTKAAQKEIQRGIQTTATLTEIREAKNNMLRELSPNTEINHIILDTKNFFGNIAEIMNEDGFRIASDEKGAGTHEAEAAISYVPYRNTFLLTLAASWTEKNYPNDEVHFLIGANLSEGMVYVDNSENYIQKMNKMLPLGGQQTQFFEVHAPYMNKTKTAMITDIFQIIKNNQSNPIISKIIEIVDSSFSCYFPKKDGSPCGECGSCLLREKAFQRAKENIK